ncbi:alanine racemase [Salinimicrobium flavum]|uniref:Alanine racemase n=1 Tax=Salinimicrobium flavum TaxID=1737065 RepID=A0ABW5IZF4_9FLAO
MLQITRPTLLLDRTTCKANIRKMFNKAERHHVQLIPHFKTHQSASIGKWFREEGVKAITVTSVKMAEYFAGRGWVDITIAFPVNVLETEQINALAEKVDLRIFLNSKEAAKVLKEQLRTPVKFYIEIDVGDHRSGIDPANLSAIAGILELTKGSYLKFDGFYTHAGHTYSAASPREVEEISGLFLKKLRALKSHFRQTYPNLKLAFGDTPSCSIIEDFEGIDSIHPGNFVYYDLVQNSIGANTLEEIAICLAVPVVSVHPERQEVVVHSGWVHQGKDSLTDSEGNTYFGLVVSLTEDSWSAPIPGGRVIKLSQEHGVISLPQEMTDQVKVGDVLGILPVHACATAFMMGELETLEGEKLQMMPR